MNYQQFTTELKEKVASLLDEDISLQLHTTLKNNGKERTGIAIEDKQVNIHPTIYLEEYYLHFQNGISIEEIAENIVQLYQEVRFQQSFDFESIKDFSAIYPKITYKLINVQKNV